MINNISIFLNLFFMNMSTLQNTADHQRQTTSPVNKALRLSPLALLLASCFLPSAHAADQVLEEINVKTTREQKRDYEVSQTRTATKIPVALRDTPQTVNIVNLPVLREQNASSVQDALQNVAGLSFSVGDGQRDQVTIRGFSAILDQFVDGVRDDAMYFRDLSNTERIEVLKGPASVLYGRGSSGGLVNRVTKKPFDTSLTEIGLTAGTAGQRRAELDLNIPSSQKGTAFRLTGALEDSSNFRNQYFLERNAIAPSFSYQISPDTKVLLQADYLHDKRLADQGVPGYRGRPVDVPVETYFGAANGKDRAFIQSDVYSASVSLDHKFSDNWQWHSVVRSYDFALNRNYTTNTVKDGVTPTLTIAHASRQRNENGTYWQNELTQKLQTGSVKHLILYGVELGYQNKGEFLRSRANAATYNLFAPQLVTLPALPDNTPVSTNVLNKVDIAGVYLQDLMTITPEWKVMAGLRYDQLRQSRDDLTPKNQDLRRTDKTVSPRIGLIWQPQISTSVYATWNRSFQPVSDLFTLRNNSDQLKPSETVNKEIGVKYDWNAQASITASVFDMSQTNIQVADPANANFSLPVGRQSTRGVELSFTGYLTPEWQVLAGYAWMRGRIDQSTELTSAKTPFQGNTASLTPTHSMNLWLRHQLTPQWYVAVGGRAESARFASADNLLTLPGYGVMQLGAGYQSEKLDVSLTLGNVLNRKYFVAAHSGANDYNMPGAPRSLTASLRYRF